MRNLVISSILSVVLLSAGWLGASGATLLVALVPLLYICSRPIGFWRCALWMGATMALWTILTVWWIWYAAPIGAIAATLIDVVMLGGVLMLYRWASRRLSRVLSYVILVSAWIGFEWVYTIGQVSFPWLVLGNGFANDIWAVQWYSTTGVFGGSLWVLVANILIWEALRRRSVWSGAWAAVWVLVPIAVSLWMLRTYEMPSQKMVKVTVLQPNIDPYNEKFVLSQQAQTANLVDLVNHSPADADFVVMPETAIDDELWEGRMHTSPSLDRLQSLLRERMPGSQWIVGATTYKHYEPGEKISRTARQNYYGGFWYDVYNSALAIDSTGVVQVHHKSKLVAGAEMMPFYNITKHLNFLIIDLGGVSGQFGVDSVHRVFTSPQGVVTAAAVCYESVYGEDFSQFVLGGAQLMLVITNDGWWRNTPGYRQHFSYSRLRAIESRRAVGRSANTGISGFIDPQGRVLQRMGWQQRGTLTAQLPLNDRLTFYTRNGDYIGRAAFYIFLVCMIGAPVYMARVRRKRG